MMIFNKLEKKEEEEIKSRFKNQNGLKNYFTTLILIFLHKNLRNPKNLLLIKTNFKFIVKILSKKLDLSMHSQDKMSIISIRWKYSP